MNRTSVISGIILIIIAIVLGAFGAHALKERLTAVQLNSFEVGVRYQMYHGLALLALGLAASQLKFPLRPFIRIILIGTIAFCVSIYLLSIQDLVGMDFSLFGPVTPIGGLLLIIAWIVLLVKIIASNPKKTA